MHFIISEPIQNASVEAGIDSKYSTQAPLYACFCLNGKLVYLQALNISSKQYH